MRPDEGLVHIALEVLALVRVRDAQLGDGAALHAEAGVYRGDLLVREVRADDCPGLARVQRQGRDRPAEEAGRQQK